MLFKDLAVGQKFILDNVVYEKRDEVTQTCCRAGSNAIAEGVLRYIDHNQEIELIDVAI